MQIQVQMQVQMQIQIQVQRLNQFQIGQSPVLGFPARQRPANDEGERLLL